VTQITSQGDTVDKGCASGSRVDIVRRSDWPALWNPFNLPFDASPGAVPEAVRVLRATLG